MWLGHDMDWPPLDMPEMRTRPVSDMRTLEIDPNRQYVIVCPDKEKALELQRVWVAFLAGGVQAIFLHDHVAVLPVEQVVGWTTWEEVGSDEAG
jgi:hypothetical protein